MVSQIPWWVEPSYEYDYRTGMMLIIYRWEIDGKAYSYHTKAGVEVTELGSPHPTYLPAVPVPQEPRPKPPPEPASVFAKRNLTEDELLDPRLFTDYEHLIPVS